jgi:hypothetical protein
VLTQTYLFIQKVRRVFKALGEATATGRKSLQLDKNVSRKRSEVHVYMSLFYDSRIRQAVKDRWAVYGKGSGIDSSRGPDVPEDLVHPEDSSILKDTKIPLFFKNQVARDLYKEEDEETKQIVRSKRDEDMYAGTVYSTEGEDREELVRAYQK